MNGNERMRNKWAMNTQKKIKEMRKIKRVTIEQGTKEENEQ